MCAPIDAKQDSLERSVKRCVSATMVRIAITYPAIVNAPPVLLATNATITVPVIRTVRIAQKRVAVKMGPNAIHQMGNVFVPTAGKEQSARIENALIIFTANTAI